jgi:hypothetical protein
MLFYVKLSLCLIKHGTRKRYGGAEVYVRVLISLWLFLFAAQPKEFILNRLKKLEQLSHKCVELRGEYVNTFFQSPSLLFSS